MPKAEPRPDLHLMLCTTCWQRVNDCSCAVSNAPGDNRDKRKLAKRGASTWKKVRVFTEQDVRDAMAGFWDDEVADALLELLSGEGEAKERRRAAAEQMRPGKRRAMRGRRVG